MVPSADNGSSPSSETPPNHKSTSAGSNSTQKPPKNRTLPRFAPSSSSVPSVGNQASKKVGNQWKTVKATPVDSPKPNTRCAKCSGCCWPSPKWLMPGKPSSCCKGRCMPMDKSSVFFLQALFLWCIVCLPGNLVTFTLYQRVSNQIALEEANNITDIELIETFIGSSTFDSVEYVYSDEAPMDSPTSRTFPNDRESHSSTTLIPVSVKPINQSQTATDTWPSNGIDAITSPTSVVSTTKPSTMDTSTGTKTTNPGEEMGHPWLSVCSEIQIKVVIDLVRDCFYTRCDELPWCRISNLREIAETSDCPFDIQLCLKHRRANASSHHSGPIALVNHSAHDLESDIYQCHEHFNEHRHFMTKAQFWIEGVSLFVVGIFGIAGNIMTVIVLGRIYSNTTFNRLLMSLAIVDTMLLIYYVLDYGIIGVFMRSKGMDEPLWYRVSFPYILHPLKWICMSASIFMVVAISAERHRAICSPLTHRPTFWPYAVVVFFVASAGNIPRFLEFHLKTIDNKTDYWTTPLNEDQDYITFSSWWDELIVTGIIPLSALVLFNSRIYLKLRASDRQEYRFVGRKRTCQNRTDSVSLASNATNLPPLDRHNNFLSRNSSKHHVVEIHSTGRGKRAYNSSPLPNGSADRLGHNNKQPLKYQKTSSIGSGEEIPLVKTESQPNANFNRNDSNTAIQLSTTSNHLQLPNGYPVPSSGEDECGNGLNQRSSFNLSASRSSPNSVPRVSSPLATKGKDGQMEPSRLLGRGSFSHLSTDSARGSGADPDTPILATAHNRVPVRTNSSSPKNEHGSHYFRKRREKSALILVSIVLIFLFCHTFRLVIQAYEVTHPSHSTAEHHDFCSQRGRFHVPVAFYVMLSASHLLLVVNSSINFLVYCCVGKSFRAELKNIIGSLCRKFC